MQRTQPWLGTLVTVGVHGASSGAAERLFTRAFGAIKRVHELMSFHEPGSDVSRLNRDAAHCAVAVDGRTYEVLQLARRLAAASRGSFDISIAPLLVADGFLPRPAGAPAPDPSARWQDIQLGRNRRVRFRKPLWIDLGGIAKGYAVDCAVKAANPPDGVTLSINAGGDLRVAGPCAVQVALAVAHKQAIAAPQLSLGNAAIASSQGHAVRRRHGRQWRGPHRHGRTHRMLPLNRFVSVVADSCAAADALTKLVIASGRRAAPLLRQFGAQALLHDGGQGWQQIGVRA